MGDSFYHARVLDLVRLERLTGQVDIGLSHDWPRQIAHHGNTAQLIRMKPFVHLATVH